MATKQILVTGAGGFIGRTVAPALAAAGLSVRALSRQPLALPGCEVRQLEQFDSEALLPQLAGVDTVVHLIGRSHLLNERAADPQVAFDAVNLQLSERLAETVAEAGVRRLVYLSSIKVNGEGSGRPYRHDDPPQPEDCYGISKWRTEQRLRELSEQHGFELVIIRPVLVYGVGVKGNLAQLCEVLKKGWPLPLATIDNRRDLLSVDNLAELIRLAATEPAAAGEVFLAADGEPLSTPQMIRALARGLGVPAKLLPLPPALLQLAGRLTGRQGQVARLCGDLQVEIDHARRLLGWQPALSSEPGLQRMAEGGH
ncbi:NAD-dependent epimerase/dehydratase family protein [Marinobacterium arenosum]|uniref:NAD-dependent epimerase/dehydratase family protein n=1 Tax=Marinobacterium arenosum TaxID=2862496 RepID=UPI001C95B566|nr:NAD-dependent epimerase/dehydratase family protein [Marinobacterium arenosum]MBY4676409.1 NAD-dependent epimerase/dehydratase family protein [Marinobacterium arenosum]